jgi:hypothetical protein
MSDEQDHEEEKSSRRQTPRSGANRADMVDKAIQRIEEKLGSSDVKATFADFIRLLQLQKELQTDQPKEIKVTWIDPNETESASEE